MPGHFEEPILVQVNKIWKYYGIDRIGPGHVQRVAFGANELQTPGQDVIIEQGPLVLRPTREVDSGIRKCREAIESVWRVGLCNVVTGFYAYDPVTLGLK